MCYGSLDPKYQMREMERQMQGIRAATPPKQTKDAPQGVWGWFITMLAAVWMKGARRV